MCQRLTLYVVETSSPKISQKVDSIHPTTLSYLHMLQTLGAMFTNSEKIITLSSYSNVV
jgi:hypothetical protein